MDSQQGGAVVNRRHWIHNRELPLLTGSVRFTTTFQQNRISANSKICGVLFNKIFL